MKYYRRKRRAGKTVKKVFFRISFVLISAFVIAVVAVLLGKRLEKTVADAEKKMEAADTASASEENIRPVGYYSTELPENERSVFAVGINPIKDDDFLERLETVKENFDAISVKITEDGKLVYVSPAMLDFARIPTENITVSEADAGYERLKNLGMAAKTENLRMCALVEASRQDNRLLPEADKVLLAELGALGFDEAIITGLDTVSENVASYLIEISNDTISVGVLFPEDFYLDEANDKLIQRISVSGVFLCVNFDTAQYETKEEINRKIRKKCVSLRSSFDTHNLRVIIDSDDVDAIQAEYAALTASNVENIQVVQEIAYETLAADFADTESSELPTEKETNRIGSEVNPYVTTTTTTADDVSELPSETEKNTEAETVEEDYYRSEGSWY